MAESADGRISESSDEDTGERVVGCATPPAYDYTIAPRPTWLLTSSRSFAATECHVYRMFLRAGRSYDFSVCVNDGVGGTCDPGDGDFRMYDSAGTPLWWINGQPSCGFDASTLPVYPNGWSPAADGYYYLKISEFWSAAATYVLAYRGVCSTPPVYDLEIIPSPSWKATGEQSFAAADCHVYRMYLEANRSYDFSLCVNDGVGGSTASSGDSDFTMFDAAGAPLWYIDGPLSCGYAATTLGSTYEGWSPPADGYYYLTISDYYENYAVTYILAYRGVCTTPPDYDFEITPSPTWETAGEQDFAAGGCHVYRMYLQAARSYDFSLCVDDGVGGWTDTTGDGDLTMYNSAGAQRWYIDGSYTCDYFDATTLGTVYEGWSPHADGYYYLKVSEYINNDAMSYNLAYRRACSTPAAPSFPSPAQGATGVDLDADLMWNAQYREDFDDGQAQGWQEDVDADWTVVSNEYRAYQAAPAASNAMVATYGGQTFDNFTYEAKFRRAEPLAYARYLLVRATASFEGEPTPAGSGYAFGLDGNEYFIFKVVSGTMTYLQTWTSSPAINPPTEWNTLKVVAQGPVLDFYINGVLVQSLTDGDLVSGRIGLLGYTSPSVVGTHFFDDVVVGPPALSRGAVSPLQEWYNEHPLEGGSSANAPSTRSVPTPPAELTPDLSTETSNAPGAAVHAPWATSWAPAERTARALGILIYADDYYHASPNTYIDQALQGLGLAYTAHYNSDFAGFQASLTGGGPWNLVIFGHEYFAGLTTGLLDALSAYVAGGGRLVGQSWRMSSFSAHALWADLGVAYVSNDYDPPDPVYWWADGHPFFNSPESVLEFTQLMSGRYTIYGQRVGLVGVGEAVAGYTAAPAANEAALVIANGGGTVFRGFMDGQNDADRDSDGVRDGVELWINIISSFFPSGCPTTYDVYFGATNPPPTLLCDDTSETTCDPGALFAGTTYYWYVLATNVAGSTTGPVWSFTTAPAEVTAAGPPHDGTLWRTQKNCIKLTFDENITGPTAAGQVLIR
ncbi:MAG: family 16 glycoside hydrolase, partial [Planctomycetota bacterium]